MSGRVVSFNTSSSDSGITGVAVSEARDMEEPERVWRVVTEEEEWKRDWRSEVVDEEEEKEEGNVGGGGGGGGSMGGELSEGKSSPEGRKSGRDERMSSAFLSASEKRGLRKRFLLLPSPFVSPIT